MTRAWAPRTPWAIPFGLALLLAAAARPDAL